MPAFDVGPPERKPRGTFWLTLGLCVLLPASGLALRYWGHLFFAPEQPAPLIEVADRSRGDAPGPSSLSLLKPEPQAAEAPPARSSLDLLAKEPLGQSEAAPTPPAALLPQSAPKAPDRRAYPTLRKTAGWRSWYQQGGGSGITYMPADNAPQLQGAPPSTLDRTTPSAATSSPARLPAAAAPARTGYRPPPVIYQANPGQTQVGPGGPTRELKVKAAPRDSIGNGASGRPDYTTFIGATERLPTANPEKPKVDGTCPHAGWWKNAYDGFCYQSRESCLAADYSHEGCTQP